MDVEYAPSRSSEAQPRRPPQSPQTRHPGALVLGVHPDADRPRPEQHR